MDYEDDEDYDDDWDDEDEDNEDDEDNEGSGGVCLTCKHWGGNARAITGCDFGQFRQATGKCYCKGTPHYYDNDHLSANDGCGYWEKHHHLK
jgi:hypothetical protein